MDYKKFQNLVRQGEKKHVDFKLECHAFMDSAVKHKAELAKDICAMANNGKRTSYLLIGVSDDGEKFQSVENDKLTDDNLQDFCKKAILPPPRVRLIRTAWKNAVRKHKGKEFVIIQIGPHASQAFHLNQDFIDYKKRVCYRRHDVWIRRERTTDLATPAEIAKLERGESLEDEERLTHRRRLRDEFNRLAKDERRERIREATSNQLLTLRYRLVSEKESQEPGSIGLPTWWKVTKGVTTLVYVVGCLSSVVKRDLIWFRHWIVPGSLVNCRKIPHVVRRLGKRVKFVRRIYLVSALAAVPAQRIEEVYPDARRLGEYPHYYLPRLRKGGEDIYPSSSELLVIDHIQSLSEYEERLTAAICAVEDATQLASVLR